MVWMRNYAFTQKAFILLIYFNFLPSLSILKLPGLCAGLFRLYLKDYVMLSWHLKIEVRSLETTAQNVIDYMAYSREPILTSEYMFEGAH